MARNLNWTRHLVWAGCLFLFVLSLFFSALEFDGGGNADNIMTGGEVLALGWLGLFIGQLAWFANIPWFISLFGVIFRIPLLAAIPALLALLIAAETPALFFMKVPRDEGGTHYMALTAIGPAAYIWAAALAVPLVWSIWDLITRKKPVTPQPQPSQP